MVDGGGAAGPEGAVEFGDVAVGDGEGGAVVVEAFAEEGDGGAVGQ